MAVKSSSKANAESAVELGTMRAWSRDGRLIWESDEPFAAGQDRLPSTVREAAAVTEFTSKSGEVRRWDPENLNYGL